MKALACSILFLLTFVSHAKGGKACTEWINFQIKSHYRKVEAKKRDFEKTYLNALNQASRIAGRKLESKGEYESDIETGLNRISDKGIEFFFNNDAIEKGWRVKKDGKNIDHCP